MNRISLRVFLVAPLLAAVVLAQAPVVSNQSPAATNQAPAANAQAPATAGAQASTDATQTAPPRSLRPGSGVVTGTVKDDTGGVIPGAVVTLTDQSGGTATVKSGRDGIYTFRGLASGTYTVSAIYTGLQQNGITAVSVSAAQPATGNIVMTVGEQHQEVTVNESSNNTVSTEAANNATALVLKQEDLDALPDDPDDMEADLQALAGPAAGPGGNQIYIDGFSGGRLPPKSSIREIRINSNPFAAEFDKLGYGRIQIFTKPGTDKFHGQAYYNISDDIWDSRNPFLHVNPPFRTQLFGGNVSGPISKKASFFVDVERRNIDDNGIVNAVIPNSLFSDITSLQTYYATPQRRTTVSPRIDYQINSNNTLSARYSYLENNHIITGIGSFNLPPLAIGNLTYPGTGYSSSETENTVQLVETAVLSPKAVNETHFIFDRMYTAEASQSDAPQLNVSQSFVSGGSGYSSPGHPNSYDLENYYELQNYTSLTLGPHTVKFGVRTRTSVVDNVDTRNFNGVYSFLGASGLSSIQQYLTTVQLLNANYTYQQIAQMGYGPSKFTVNGGNPYIALTQSDFGPFVQDDWRARPNLTFSFGLRWESQTNIHDHSDWAPRFGFAWSPDAKGGSGRAKTVIRGGWGIFYDRFTATNVITARRYQQSDPLMTYTVDDPQGYNAQFNTPVSSSELTAENANQRYQIDSALQAPRLMQTAIGVERQLFSHTNLAVNFLNSRGTHELRTVDINAPYPIPGQLPPRAAGNSTAVCCRPFPNEGDIYDYQSDGTFKQTLVLVNVNSSVGKWLTLFGRYSYGTAHSDTDGLATQPADPYNFAADWGRSSLDIAHNLFLGGSIAAPWGLRFSPFIVAHTGTPFNITTGTDLYLTGSITPTARPSVAASSDLVYGVPVTGYDAVPLVPEPGTLGSLIERNAATGPGFIGLNLRVSKTWGFGTTKFSGPSGGARAGGGGGPRGGGGFGGFGGGGGGGPRGLGESTEHRFNVTASINARNIINHENLNTPNGSISSPYFLESTGITGGFGAESTASNQRRIDLQLRFAF